MALSDKLKAIIIDPPKSTIDTPWENNGSIYALSKFRISPPLIDFEDKQQ
jgi:hypothetical protein